MSSRPVPDRAAASVRAMRTSDLAASAALHARLLPDGFFPQLGAHFLREYHRTFVVSPHAVALVATVDDRIHGFLVAVSSPSVHGSYVLRACGARLLLAGCAALAVRPRVLTLFVRSRARRYARGLWRRLSPPTPATHATAGRWAVLSHVAVDPDLRGRGAGGALVTALHDRLLKHGVDGVVLVTAPDGDGPAFYDRLGYDREGELVDADGQTWLRYRYRLV
jgi:ribosomal protein S18 acetylase RimI-like enzyme